MSQLIAKTKEMEEEASKNLSVLITATPITVHENEMMRINEVISRNAENNVQVDLLVLVMTFLAFRFSST